MNHGTHDAAENRGRVQSPRNSPTLYLACALPDAPWRRTVTPEDGCYLLALHAYRHQDTLSDSEHESFWRGLLALWPRRPGGGVAEIRAEWIWLWRRHGATNADIDSALHAGCDSLAVDRTKACETADRHRVFGDFYMAESRRLGRWPTWEELRPFRTPRIATPSDRGFDSPMFETISVNSLRPSERARRAELGEQLCRADIRLRQRFHETDREFRQIGPDAP